MIRSEKIKSSKQQCNFTRLHSHPTPFQLGYFNDVKLVFQQILIPYNLLFKNFLWKKKNKLIFQ